MATTEDLKARLEAFRIEYRKSQEAGQRLAAELAPAGDAAGEPRQSGPRRGGNRRRWRGSWKPTFRGGRGPSGRRDRARMAGR
jgi:hypothetical protein